MIYHYLVCTRYPYFATYSLNIIYDSFASSIFPTSLKTVVIRPILKKAGLKKNNLNNYRPIAKLSVFSKLIELLETDYATSDSP